MLGGGGMVLIIALAARTSPCVATGNESSNQKIAPSPLREMTPCISSQYNIHISLKSKVTDHLTTAKSDELPHNRKPKPAALPAILANRGLHKRLELAQLAELARRH